MILTPGPGFDCKKMSANDLRMLVEAYVDSILNGSEDKVMFTVEKWRAGGFLFL